MGVTPLPVARISVKEIETRS